MTREVMMMMMIIIIIIIIIIMTMAMMMMGRRRRRFEDVTPVFLRTQDFRAMMCCVVVCVVPNASKEFNAFIFKQQAIQERC
jgi:hypothetical protein